MTTKSKGYPFEVALGAGSGVTGIVLVDQVKSIDWVQRQASLIGQVHSATLDAVRAMLKTILQTP